MQARHTEGPPAPDALVAGLALAARIAVGTGGDLREVATRPIDDGPDEPVVIVARRAVRCVLAAVPEQSEESEKSPHASGLLSRKGQRPLRPARPLRGFALAEQPGVDRFDGVDLAGQQRPGDLHDHHPPYESGPRVFIKVADQARPRPLAPARSKDSRET